MKKQFLIILVTVLAVTIALSSTLLFIAPSFSIPTIDGSWLIVCHTEDIYDNQSANWIRDKYGASIVAVQEFEGYNNFGQNILILGGSTYLSKQAPWLELWPYRPLEIIRPDTYPGVRYDWDYSLNAWIIITPKTVYYPTSSNELGFIARGYDYKLRRWVVAVLGYDWWGTTYGAKFIVTQWSTVITPTYVIYKTTEHGGVNPATWTLDQFNGSIIEEG